MDFFLLVVVSPGSYAQMLFCIFEKKIFKEYFSFSLRCDPMGAKTSKRYSSLKSLLNPLKLFLNFVLSGPHKSAVLDF